MIRIISFFLLYGCARTCLSRKDHACRYKYKKSEATLEKASRLAGVSLSKMIDILAEYGVESNLEYEDYLKGLKTLRKLWP